MHVWAVENEFFIAGDVFSESVMEQVVRVCRTDVAKFASFRLQRADRFESWAHSTPVGGKTRLDCGEWGESLTTSVSFFGVVSRMAWVTYTEDELSWTTCVVWTDNKTELTDGSRDYS
jgi:hypothetical protein